MGSRNESRSNPAEKAERQVRAFELVRDGHSLRSAAAQMKLEGYTRVSHVTVKNLVELEAAERVSPVAEQWRTVLLERLNDARLNVLRVLRRDHLTISDGQIVRLDGEPIIDDAPVLQAVDRLVKIDTQIAKLVGAEAPVQSEIAATITRPPEILALIAAAEADAAAAEARLNAEASD